jgi:hypothetical protein
MKVVTALEARKIRGAEQRRRWRARRLYALELRERGYTFSKIGYKMGVSRSQAQLLVILGRREDG